MDEKEIEEGIQKALSIVEKIPDDYRLITYEAILPIILGTNVRSPNYPRFPERKSVLRLPTDVQVFLKTYQIPEDCIDTLYMMDDEDNIHPVYKISTSGKDMAPFQIYVSLLVALDEAMKGNGFKASQEVVRKKVKDLKIYDSTHFPGNFKSRKDLYIDVKKGADLELSERGKEELASMVKELLHESE
jgi:hypothetical protein